MRIALVNPITQTIDRPNHFWKLFSRGPQTRLLTDADINFVKLAQAMADLGHEVSLFVSDSFKPKEPYTPRGFLKIYYLPTRAKFFFPPAYMPFLPTLSRELKRGRFDVIQTAELFQPSTAIAALAGPPVFVWEEVDQYFSRTLSRILQRGYHLTIEKWLKPKGIRIIPRSLAVLKFLEKRGWQKTGEVIPTPVDTDLFKPLPTACEEYLLVVTRLAPDRGLSFLLDVLEKVVVVQPDIKLLIVGNGCYKAPFQKEIQERNLTQNIEIEFHFLSHAELNKIYNGSTMTLITTVGGLYPYTASESMACGKLVISRFKRALKDLIQDDKTGYLVDTADEMAKKIIALLQNKEKRLEMGAQARKFVSEYCDLKKVAQSFISTYSDHIR